MNLKTKICKSCGKLTYIFSKGDCKYCANKRYAENSKRKRCAIRKVGKKRLGQLSKYKKVKSKYLEENRICEVDGCGNQSNQIHHKKGRDGYLLCEVEFFMACCGSCHPRRIHETEVEWAKEKGYLLNRN